MGKELALSLQDVSVEFTVGKQALRACDNVSMDIYRGDVVGIIGESGSGKSTLASAILRTLKSPGKITSGRILYYPPSGTPVDIAKLSEREYAKYRWEQITTVFQAAQNVFNPSLRIRDHFLETAAAHDQTDEKEVLLKAVRLLENVRLEERVLGSYPHQLSGGMKQRVVIALSLILEPDILILDEPTTALDVITQWYIINILRQIHKETGITMIFLTHDISVISSIVNRLAVMYAGQIVEYGSVEDVINAPTHAYTFGLMRTVPSLRDDLSKRMAIPGFPPNMLQLPDLCRFSPRCSLYLDGKCEGDLSRTQTLYNSGEEQVSRCYKWQEVKAYAADGTEECKQNVSG